MREALTETFRDALAAAQSAARELNQDFVGTEHLMLGVSNLKDLIALAKKKPGEISYATTGVGRLTHLFGELFRVFLKKREIAAEAIGHFNVLPLTAKRR